MAIAFARLHPISRAKGHSAVAAIAYRSGQKFLDERTGKVEDYHNRSEHVAYSEILLPDGADERFKNREVLWNAVEAAEDTFNTRRSQAQVARDCILALPRDENMTHADHVELARRFAFEHFVQHGLVADINIHYDTVEDTPNANVGAENGTVLPDKKIGRNPHAHILVSTRRLIGAAFDRHKARDLNPKFYKGSVVDPDKLWHDEWRQMQNAYFVEKGLELEVDPNGLISQVHLGKSVFHSPHRENTQHWKENEARKAEALTLSLTSPESILNQITLERTVFTQAELAKLIDRLLTKQDITDPAVFQKVLLNVTASNALIALGAGSDGKEYFTTRAILNTENDIQQFADYLKTQTQHTVSSRTVERAVSLPALANEQRDAVRYLLGARGIRALVSPDSAAKHAVLAVARDAWVDAGFRVHGMAVSGNAAKTLGAKTNITSRTVEAFRYGLRDGRIKLNKRDVVVMDNADVINSHAYREVISACAHAGAKVVYAGDPHKGGAAMRALLERTGQFDLTSAQVQQVPWQRKAARYFADEKMEKAVQCFADNDRLHFSKTAASTQAHLIADWHSTVKTHGVASSLITALNEKSVAALNQAARQTLIAEGSLNAGVQVQTAHGPLPIAIGERLQLLKNDKTLGITNGDFASVTRLSRDKKGRVLGLELRLDSQPNKPLMLDLARYDAIDYGYAARLNQVRMSNKKTDYAFTYVSGWGWNAPLAYVANTHHRRDTALYVDEEHYADSTALAKAFGRPAPKDSLYDWPWHFRERRGMPVNDNVVSRFKQHLHRRLQRATQHVRDQVEQTLLPEKYWSRKQREAAIREKTAAKKAQYQDATRVYAYTEAAKASGKLWHQLLSDKQKLEGQFDDSYDLTNHTLYQEALEALAKRDAIAAELQTDIGRYQGAIAHYQLSPETIEKQANSYTGRAIVEQYVNECKRQRPLHRNKLAHTISQDSSRFAAGMAYYDVDWATLREQGRDYARKVLLNRLDEAGKHAFGVVEDYHQTAIAAGKQWKAYFNQKQTGVDEALLVDELQAAQATSRKRNALAATIIQDNTAYQTGLQFYHIEKAEHVTDVYTPYDPAKGREKPVAETVFAKRAVKLERYGQQHLAGERFKQYQAATTLVEKSELADWILRYPHFHNRYIAKAAKGDKHVRNDLYNALRNDAVVARRKRLLPRLSQAEQDALPLVDQLFATRQSLRARWKAYFDADKPEALLPDIYALITERDRHALTIVKNLALYQKGLALYEIKPEHLEQSMDFDACRERVRAFMSPFTPTAEKIRLADFIATERGAHTQAAQQAGLDWRSVYPYADIKRHAAIRETLDLSARGDFQFVGRYRRLSLRLARVMRQKGKQQRRWTPKQQAQFDRLAALRNQMASQLLDDVDRYIAYLDAYRLTPEKLHKHASGHTVVAAQLHVYRDKRVQLIKTFNVLVKQHGSVEALGTSQAADYLAWRKQWSQLAPLAKQWTRQSARLALALKSAGLTEKQLHADATLLSTLDRLVEVSTGKAVKLVDAPSDESFVMPVPVQVGKGRKQFDSKLIKARLNECAEAVAMAAVSGDETLNTKMSNGTKLIWGKKGGSLQVTISGANTGFWNDFSQTGRGGRDLLSFISVQQGLSFKESIDWAARFLGLSEGDMITTAAPKQLDVREQQAISSATFSPDEWKRIASARKYWNESLPLAQSLAEDYLVKHRAYTGNAPDFYRYHPSVWNAKAEKKYPALLVGAKNSNGEIQAIQAIYLAPDANKISVEESPLRKWSRGVFKGAGVWLNGFDPKKLTAIVEGPETAASVLEANGHKWNVVCACGSKNFKQIGLPHEAKAVVLILDHDVDNAQTEQNALDTLSYYADRGVDAWFVKPTTAGYDFNDVHQHDGIKAVKTQLAKPTLFRKGLDVNAALKTFVDEMSVEARANLMSPEGWQRETKRLATLGQTSMALDLLQQQAMLTHSDTFARSIREMVVAWGNSRHKEEPHAAVMVCQNEQDRRLLNETAHEFMRLSGQITALHRLTTSTGRQDMGVGSAIRFIDDWEQKGIKANTLATIKSIEGAKICVRCDDGRKLTFSLSAYNAIENGYALTPKAALDKPCQKTFMLASKGVDADGIKAAMLAGNEMALHYNAEQFKQYRDLKQKIDPALAAKIKAATEDAAPKQEAADAAPKKQRPRYRSPTPFDD